MEIIGDDKKLRALYSETRLVDEQVTPSFSATWHSAESRAKQPRRTFTFAFASALALVIFAVATFAIWSKYSTPPQTYSAFATVAAANLALPNNGSTETTQAALLVNHPIRSRASKLAAQRQQLRPMAEAGLELLEPPHESLNARRGRVVDHRTAPYQTMVKSTMSSIQITRETRTDLAI